MYKVHASLQFRQKSKHAKLSLQQNYNKAIKSLTSLTIHGYYKLMSKWVNEEKQIHLQMI